MEPRHQQWLPTACAAVALAIGTARAIDSCDIAANQCECESTTNRCPAIKHIFENEETICRDFANRAVCEGPDSGARNPPAGAINNHSAPSVGADDAFESADTRPRDRVRPHFIADARLFPSLLELFVNAGEGAAG